MRPRLGTSGGPGKAPVRMARMISARRPFPPPCPGVSASCLSTRLRTMDGTRAAMPRMSPKEQ
eukprot:2495379-Alexandrium_andersonii.AAC.1